MDINLTLIGQTIAMIVFVWFCMKYIWPPLLESIEERRQKIEEGLAAADRGEEKLVQARAEAEEIIADARRQATTIIDQANGRANEIVADGKADAVAEEIRSADGKAEGVKERERQIAAAEAEIEQEINRAREELRGQVSAIAMAGAEKILKREIDADVHDDILGKLAQNL